jgi:predicted transcriptional regulator
MEETKHSEPVRAFVAEVKSNPVDLETIAQLQTQVREQEQIIYDLREKLAYYEGNQQVYEAVPEI